MKGATERKENPGWFRAGPDTRRHIFSESECVAGGVIGFQRCLEKHPDMYGYLMARALSVGRQRDRRRRAGESACRSRQSD